MYSEVEIVNYALGALGKEAIREFSTNETDPITGRLTKRMYDITRDSIISKHDWSFARGTVYLNKVEGITHPEGTLYALPSDCFVPRRIGPRLGAPATWHVESGNVVIPTALIVANGNQPILRYTKFVSTTANFKPYFVEALYYEISAILCMPLTRDVKLAQALVKQAGIKLLEAKLVDSNVGNGDDHVSQDLIYDTFITGVEATESFNG